MNVTIVLPISRKDYLKEVFKCLLELEKPDDTELLIVIDGDKKLEKVIDKYLDSISFSSIRIINHTQGPATTINERRYRISDIHNQAKHHVSDRTDYVFLVEDDTTYPPDTLVKMMDTMLSPMMFDDGFIEGVELGRHNTPYIGAWQCDDIDDPTVIKSAMVTHDRGLSSIDAGGLYCCLVGYNLYKNHFFEPFDKEGTNGLSCDVNFGLWITRKGHGCYIDWSIKCDHLSERGPINIDNTKPAQVVFEKTHNRWKARTV